MTKPTVVFWWCPRCQCTSQSALCDLCGEPCRREEEEEPD